MRKNKYPTDFETTQFPTRVNNARAWTRWSGLAVILTLLTPSVYSQFDPQPDPPGIPAPEHWWSGDGHARDLEGEAHGTE